MFSRVMGRAQTWVIVELGLKILLLKELRFGSGSIAFGEGSRLADSSGNGGKADIPAEKLLRNFIFKRIDFD